MSSPRVPCFVSSYLSALMRFLHFFVCLLFYVRTGVYVFYVSYFYIQSGPTAWHATIDLWYTKRYVERFVRNMVLHRTIFFLTSDKVVKNKCKFREVCDFFCFFSLFCSVPPFRRLEPVLRPRTKTEDHSKYDQMLLVKTGRYLGFCVTVGPIYYVPP